MPSGMAESRDSRRRALAEQHGDRKAYATGHPTHSQVAVVVSS